jgi:hypothetical protein
VAVLTPAVLAVAAIVPASAGAVTFGADLNQPANNPITCEDGWPNQAAIGLPPELGIPLFYGPFGSQSCLWLSSGFYPPTGGTVTAVRVKAALTGRMRIVVVRSLYENTLTPGKPLYACCIIQQYGPEFTAQGGAVTTVPTALPMQEDATPPPEDTTTIAAGDQLALEVLSPNVPVPAFATQNGAPDYGVVDLAWFPGPAQNGTPAPSPDVVSPPADFSGFQVLMSADLETGGGGGGGGAGGAPGAGAPTGGGAPQGPAALPAIGLPANTIPVHGNTATVPVQCLVLDCTGLLDLQSAPQARLARVASHAKPKRHAKPKPITYGSAHFSIPAGKSAKIKVKLGAAARKLLKRRHSLKVWANVTFTAGGGKPYSVAVTLKG